MYCYFFFYILTIFNGFFFLMETSEMFSAQRKNVRWTFVIWSCPPENIFKIQVQDRILNNWFRFSPSWFFTCQKQYQHLAFTIIYPVRKGFTEHAGTFPAILDSHSSSCTHSHIWKLPSATTVCAEISIHGSGGTILEDTPVVCFEGELFWGFQPAAFKVLML